MLQVQDGWQWICHRSNTKLWMTSNGEWRWQQSVAADSLTRITFWGMLWGMLGCSLWIYQIMRHLGWQFTISHWTTHWCSFFFQNILMSPHPTFDHLTSSLLTNNFTSCMKIIRLPPVHFLSQHHPHYILQHHVHHPFTCCLQVSLALGCEPVWGSTMFFMWVIQWVHEPVK